jgi:hypothetical protein
MGSIKVNGCHEKTKLGGKVSDGFKRRTTTVIRETFNIL